MRLAKIYNLEHIIETYTPHTSFLLDGKIKPFDRPQHVLSFPGLSILDRYKLGISLAKLRLKNNWEELEKVTAEEWLIDNMGPHVYKKMWKPMLIGKWGKYYNQINMAWFWARIHVRTQKLMYPNGGFQRFTDEIVEGLVNKGVKFCFNQKIRKVKDNFKNGSIFIDEEKYYDKVLLTVGPELFCSLVDSLPDDFNRKINKYHSCCCC